MKIVPSQWLRTAFCSTLVFTASGAFAQAKADKPAAVPGTAEASPPAKQSDPAPSKEQCIESHRQSQQSQNEGKLVHARELARTCTSLVCPGLVISDCARWLNDLDQRIPSVVFEVRVDGQPNLAAVIVADGKRVQEWTRGESLRLDPGEHQFRFELAAHPPVIQTILLGEGMRYRIVSADFRAQTPAAPLANATTLAPTAPVAPPPPPPVERPTPVIVYPLLGLGALGAVGFTVFGLMGRSKQGDLENSCKPTCTNDELKPMKTSYLVGDISLGVGAASLVAAGVLYLARPEKSAIHATIGMSPLPGGAATVANIQF